MSGYFRLPNLRPAPAGPALLAAARLVADRRGVTVLEYALIAAFTAMLIVTATALFGGNATLSYGKISDVLDPNGPVLLPPDHGAGAIATPSGPAAAAPCLAGPPSCTGDHFEVKLLGSAY